MDSTFEIGGVQIPGVHLMQEHVQYVHQLPLREDKIGSENKISNNAAPQFGQTFEMRKASPSPMNDSAVVDRLAAKLATDLYLTEFGDRVPLAKKWRTLLAEEMCALYVFPTEVSEVSSLVLEKAKITVDIIITDGSFGGSADPASFDRPADRTWSGLYPEHSTSSALTIQHNEAIYILATTHYLQHLYDIDILALQEGSPEIVSRFAAAWARNKEAVEWDCGSRAISFVTMGSALRPRGKGDGRGVYTSRRTRALYDSAYYGRDDSYWGTPPTLKPERHQDLDDLTNDNRDATRILTLRLCTAAAFTEGNRMAHKFNNITLGNLRYARFWSGNLLFNYMGRYYPGYLSDPSFQPYVEPVIRVAKAMKSMPADARPFFMLLAGDDGRFGYTKVLAKAVNVCKAFLHKSGIDTTIAVTQLGTNVTEVGEQMANTFNQYLYLRKKIQLQSHIGSGARLFRMQAPLEDHKAAKELVAGIDDGESKKGVGHGGVSGASSNVGDVADLYGAPGVSRG